MKTPACLAGIAIALAVVAPAQASFTQEPGSPFDVGFRPIGEAVADFNKDGRPDIVTIDQSTASVLLRRPTGGYALETPPMGMPSGPSDVAVADFNGDGRLDFAVGTYVGNALAVMLRQPTGGFAVEGGAAMPLGFGSQGVAAGEFAGDAKPDLAIASRDTGDVRIFRRDASGFTSVGTYATEIHPLDVVAANFDGAGGTDLAISNNASGSVTVLLRQGGGFTEETGSPFTVGAVPDGMLARDFNGDGRPDIAVVNNADDNVTFLLRQPGGGFAQAPVQPAVGDGPANIDSADFNSDGRADIAVANQNAGTVTVLLRTATGGWAPDPSSPVAADDGSTGIAATDINADGRPDLAIANLLDNSVSILLNSTPRPVPPPPDLDIDNDGVNRPLDCDDNDAARFPGNTDIPGDGIDQDCDGADDPYPRLRRDVSYAYSIFSGPYTTLTSFGVKPARRGDRIRFRCKGPGCSKHRKTINVTKNKRKLSLLRLVKRAKFRKGAVVTVRVTQPAKIGAYVALKFRGGKKPRKIERCLPPGTTKPVRCAK